MSDDKELIKVATELKKDFLEAADDLDKHVKNVNIARISGSSVAIVGGATAVAAGIAAFFTFGITIPIAIAAAVVATTGGVTARGASIAGFVISKKRMNRMEERWKKFKELYGPPELEEKQGSRKTFAGLAGEAGAAGAAGAAAGGARHFAYVFALLGGYAMLGLSIYDVVDASLEIHREKKSPAGDTLRKLAEELDDFIDRKRKASGQGKC